LRWDQQQHHHHPESYAIGRYVDEISGLADFVDVIPWLDRTIRQWL
jgi:hypothetical protein